MVSRSLYRARSQHLARLDGTQLLRHTAQHQQVKTVQVFRFQDSSNSVDFAAHFAILQELHYLNMAVNNVTRIENLQRCESLAKLDLTINFIDKAGLLSVPSLAANVHLTELILMGNPCTEWSGYRQFVIASLPRLKKLVCFSGYLCNPMLTVVVCICSSGSRSGGVVAVVGGGGGNFCIWLWTSDEGLLD
jgi:hypothetical protein